PSRGPRRRASPRRAAPPPRNAPGTSGAAPPPSFPRRLARRRRLVRGRARLEAAFLQLGRTFFRQLVELPQRRELRQIFETEELQEILRRPVEDRPPDLFLLPEQLHEPLLQEHLEHPPAVHPAHVLTLGARDRLP